ncbi:18S rRNA maturation protein [Lobosporangium transversale]|uniref:rRNA-processing protein EFG1 n=1 Tax=Lobosporangium transversale TaxID=64571 RepID=A0A1Y2GSY8_9FUNG|nr:hypothetical protein BCR41DRAFT_420814 [Lobosporangium transversale]KAF9898846.1 18S rRNA maturation protein [Lobosporangium transversale]ORZ21904.1 hypothetical protein BCR41DRAFT_420814 [Lobosporangium transversale]|eukprot:XP_021883155.1 hypothetical protein BCR41DRAFT_420814 [Lobosporangium transversale]
MPAAKKIVNPEKELRGKKPYNRHGYGGQKKTYQAKPKKLDEGEVFESAAALKKKLRDTLRLLSKNPKMPADIRQEHERRVEALKLQIAEKQVNQTEQKMATKYRMLKFFESKKADRKIKVFMRQHPNWESNEDEKKELESLKLDLAYIQHFPKTQKYISLYPHENADDPKVARTRDEIREKIRVGLESGHIQQFIKEARDEAKAKIINTKKDMKMTTEEAIRLTAEKINSSKQKKLRYDDHDSQDPLAARAKATAERDAAKSKPQQQQAVETEEETFFETVPLKVVPAAEVKTVGTPTTPKSNKQQQDNNNEPAKKKAKVEKKASAPAHPSQELSRNGQQSTVKHLGKEQQQQQKQKEQAGKEQLKADTKKEAAAGVTASGDSQPAGDSEVKKLGKWARKAMRAHSAAAAKEINSAAVETTTTGLEPTLDDKNVPEKKEISDTGKATVTKESSSEENMKPTEKSKDKEKHLESEKMTKVKQMMEEKKGKEPNNADTPKITTLKIDPTDDRDNDLSEDSSSDNEQPIAPIRKVVKVDESLLKELPEVPKRRGGRNLNKFKK